MYHVSIDYRNPRGNLGERETLAKLMVMKLFVPFEVNPLKT